MGTSRLDTAAKAIAAMPRRTAVQGMAGLAALSAAALTPGAASAKKKKKKKNKNKNKVVSGTLVRIQRVVTDGSINPTSTGIVQSICPDPAANESVFVLGGGFLQINADDVVILDANSAQVVGSNQVLFSVRARNPDVNGRGLTVQAICGYFRK